MYYDYTLSQLDPEFQAITAKSKDQVESRSSDAEIMFQIASSRAQVMLFFGIGNTYTDVCKTNEIIKAFSKLPSNTRQCEDISTGWAMNAQLSQTASSEWFCADASGFLGKVPTDTITSMDDTTC